MNAKSLILGIVGTVVWLLIIFIFAVLKGYELPNSLNELGDALAGIVAPIAFFWLILGYVQQGKQLDQNTRALEQQEKALNLQIIEMKESVRQQKELVEVQNKQMHSIHVGEEPSLIFLDGKVEIRITGKIITCVLKVELENVGIGSARNICIFNKEENYLTSRLVNRDQSLDKYTLKSEDKIKINTYFRDTDLVIPDEGDLGLLKLYISYEGIYKKRYNEEFIAIIDSTGKPNIYDAYF